MGLPESVDRLVSQDPKDHQDPQDHRENVDHREAVDHSADLEIRVQEVRLDHKENQDRQEYLEDLELLDFQDHVDHRYVSIGSSSVRDRLQLAFALVPTFLFCQKLRSANLNITITTTLNPI